MRRRARARVGARADVRVECGDANETDTSGASGEPARTQRRLSCDYLDPDGLKDLCLEHRRYLAEQFGFIDLIINLPVNSLMRGITGAYGTGYRGRAPRADTSTIRTPTSCLRCARTGRLILLSDDRCHPWVLRRAAPWGWASCARETYGRLSARQPVLRRPSRFTTPDRAGPMEQDEPGRPRPADIAAGFPRRRV